MAILKDRLDALASPSRVGIKERAYLLASEDKYIERIFRMNTCLPYMQ